MDEAVQEFPNKAREGLCGKAFPKYDGEFYIPEGFEDISIANDVVPCPSIMDKEAIVVIRQDFADPSKRVMDGKRYRVDVVREELMEGGYEHCQPLFSTEDFQASLSYAKEKMPELKDIVEETIADERREEILGYQNPRPRNVYDDFYVKAHAVAVDMASEKPIYCHDDDPTVEAVAMMLLEKKHSKSAIYRVFKECSPLTTYPGREDEIAKQTMAEIERRGAERFVSAKFFAHLPKQKEAAR